VIGWGVPVDHMLLDGINCIAIIIYSISLQARLDASPLGDFVS
jgi:hypothetical protein